jgi:hypothetical protein
MSVARGQMVCLHIRVGPGRTFHFRHRSGVVNHRTPTADRPWPFTSREYGRLLLLRSRVGAQRQTAL